MIWKYKSVINCKMTQQYNREENLFDFEEHKFLKLKSYLKIELAPMLLMRTLLILFFLSSGIFLWAGEKVSSSFSLDFSDGSIPNIKDLISNYKAGQLEVVDGILKMDHTEYNSSFSYRVPEVLTGTEGSIVLNCRLRIPAGNGDNYAFAFGLAPKSKQGIIHGCFCFSAKEILTPWKKINFDNTVFHNFKLMVNLTDYEVEFSADGKVLASGKFAQRKNIKSARLYFGDGSKKIFGTAELTALSISKQNLDGQAVRNSLPKRSKPLCFSTTIDFLDYVFVYKGKENIYPLEEYERVMKELAECGIKKVYLRVHGSGLPLYPSKVTEQYGTGDAWHWRNPESSARLIKTIRTYDICTETIRLAHKYGMEAWAWEALFDNGRTYYALESWERQKNPELMKIAQRNDFIPMLDPVMRKNLNFYAMADPRFVPFPEEKKKINQSVKGAKIGKIIMQGVKCSKINLRKEDIEIYYANNNFNYSYAHYDKPFSIILDKTPDGANRLTLDNLNIDAKFVKLIHKTRYKRYDYGFSTKSRGGESRVYDTNGKLLYTVWAGAGRSLGTPLNFTRCRRDLRFDSLDLQIGFVVGEPEDEKTRYFLGVAELAVPAAMEYKVARFAELAQYPFDGFMLNWRSHSSVQAPLRYGFNPEVREKFLQRHGKDIWRDSFALADLLQLRAEAVAEFYKRCKALTSGRPLYATGYAPAKPGELPQHKIRSMGDEKTAYIPMLYSRYFADGSLDGIMMAGSDFSETLTQYRSGCKSVKIGAFRELSTGYYFTRKYDFAEDMEKLYANPRLDEVELYETLLLTKRPAARAVIKRLSKQNPCEANAGNQTETYTEKFKNNK